MRLVLIVCALLMAGSAGAGRADARPRTRTAQAPATVDAAASAVVRAERDRARLIERRVALTRRYEAELIEIDRLKRRKPSWRRDRDLRARLSASLETARALSALAGRITHADATVSRARAAAVAAVDRVLPAATGARRAELLRRRRAWAPPAPARRIVIPDDALDPLADPEELDQQAAALRDSEDELTAELDRLDAQAERFERMAVLRRQHERAEEMALHDQGDPRRVGGHGSFEGVSATVDTAPDREDVSLIPDAEPDLATVLADVVDTATVDALRRADRSTDPAQRAAATRRARGAVGTRLELLRRRRAAIEARARELRRPAAGPGARPRR